MLPWPIRPAPVNAGCTDIVLRSAEPTDSADEGRRRQWGLQPRSRRQTKFFEMLLVAVCSILLGERVLAVEQVNRSSVKERMREQVSLKKEDLRQMEEGIVRLTNHYRTRKGLTALELSPALRLLARRQSKNMCTAGLLAHESKTFDEGWQKFSERLSIVGVRSGGENIAFGTILKEPEEWTRMIMKGWMKSPEHRKSILNPKFRYLGIAVVPCKDNIAYATQVFSAEPGRIPLGQLTR